MNYTQNEKIEQVTDTTMVVGIDIGSQTISITTNPKYMWYGATSIKAKWISNAYKLTLNYNGADKSSIPDWGTKISDQVYNKDNFLQYDSGIGGIFGPGTIKRTGYKFNGWYLYDSSGNKVFLWNENGSLIKPLLLNNH